MQWVRLETAFPTNPKVLALVEDKAFRALFVYVCSLSYAGLQETDGYIPRVSLPLIHASKREVDKLVAVGLWVPSGKSGWEVNGWQEFQPSTEDMQRRKARAKAAAEIRWHGQSGDDEPC